MMFNKLEYFISKCSKFYFQMLIVASLSHTDHWSPQRGSAVWPLAGSSPQTLPLAPLATPASIRHLAAGTSPAPPTHTPHLSPAFFKFSDQAPDWGILQSELFTSRSLVSPKLPSLGFWRYGQFFKWNRVKIAKNGFKMVEIFFGSSHTIKNTIFNIFCFSTFSFGYFLDLVFRAIFSKFGQNTGFVKYPKEKVKKTKNIKNVISYHMWCPPKISTIYWPFLPYFIWQIGFMYLQKPELGNLVRTRFWLLLANKSLCSIPKSGARSEI